MLPPSPPPAFEYHYWKCYYAANSPSFKAAALFSVEVDYYQYGSCRLAGDGAYYCGALSAIAPWKGLANTADSPHVGTDRISKGLDVATGTHVGSTWGNWAKVRQPYNPDYYSKATPTATEFVQKPTNNGLETAVPSKTFRTGTPEEATAYYNQQIVSSQAHLGRAPLEPRDWKVFDVEARASNYGMGRTTASHYNKGIHVVGSAGVASSGAANMGPIAYGGASRYSTATVQDYR